MGYIIATIVILIAASFFYFKSTLGDRFTLDEFKNTLTAPFTSGAKSEGNRTVSLPWLSGSSTTPVTQGAFIEVTAPKNKVKTGETVDLSITASSGADKAAGSVVVVSFDSRFIEAIPTGTTVLTKGVVFPQELANQVSTKKYNDNLLVARLDLGDNSGQGVAVKGEIAKLRVKALKPGTTTVSLSIASPELNSKSTLWKSQSGDDLPVALKNLTLTIE